ncbi:glycoside hydrolase family 3 C-terminal domain-containing protein [soil metagenome]
MANWCPKATLVVLAASSCLATPTLADPARVASLVGRMTPEEKLSFLAGSLDPEHVAGAGYIPGVPRLNIPPLRMADGPAGVRGLRPATAFPAPVALVATFSPDLASAWGKAVAEEALARGQNVMLAPMMNSVRAPRAGRNFETSGEDPTLAASMVAATVRGLQSGGVIATLKHFAANNQETDRVSIDARVEERTLREIEFPPFKAGVDAGAGAVMCAYNKLNGVFACENPFLLDQVLRKEWGFTGFVMSDWFATHSGATALKAGLDMEMPFVRFMGPQLKGALDADDLAQADVDRAVTRILTQMDRVGLLDGQGGNQAVETNGSLDAHADLALKIAEQGAVLLKNQGDLLPLGREQLAGALVVGFTAERPLFGGGGSAAVIPTRLDTPFDALSAHAGGPVMYAEGLRLEGEPVPADALSADGAPGLRAADGTRTASVDFTAGKALAPGRSQAFQGMITAPETGEYDLMLHYSGLGGFEIPEDQHGQVVLELDGQVIISGGQLFGGARLIQTPDGLLNQGYRVRLKGGVPHAIKIRVKALATSPTQLRLSWTTPAQRRVLLAQAVAKAKSASVAVVFAHMEGAEGVDNTSLGLPDGQNELIAAVAAANPNTVVILNTGAPVLMPWLGNVKAVLQMWYPGQRGGEATAAILTGKVNPSGRLPVTYPKSEAQTPVAPVERFPGVEGRQLYSEGVLTGYRWYDEKGATPLFPFGFGLSYTHFEYSRLEVQSQEDGLAVSFDLRNTGPRDGEEVAQVYLDRPASFPEGLVFAPRTLAGFVRVSLRAGESRRVLLKLDRQKLAYWSPDKSAWRMPVGPRGVEVGGSSRDLPLKMSLRIEP